VNFWSWPNFARNYILQYQPIASSCGKLEMVQTRDLIRQGKIVDIPGLHRSNQDATTPGIVYPIHEDGGKCAEKKRNLEE